MVKRLTSLRDLGPLFGKEPEEEDLPDNSGHNTVYRTGVGRIKPATASTSDGYTKGQPVLISKQRKGRGGKTVSVIENLPLSQSELAAMAVQLRKQTGTGGTVKNHAIELQGDHTERLLDLLTQQGFTVKVSGL